MEMEISRVNLLENFDGLKKTALRVALFGFPAIIFGLIVEDGLIAQPRLAIKPSFDYQTEDNRGETERDNGAEPSSSNRRNFQAD